MMRYHQRKTMESPLGAFWLLLLFLLAILLLFQHGVAGAAAWLGISSLPVPHVHRPRRGVASSLFSSVSSSPSPSPEEEAKRLQEQAARLRLEVSQLEQAKQDAQQQEEQQLQQEREAKQEVRNQYSATVPILKPDGIVEEEQVDFSPYYKDGSSCITSVEASLPLGILLGESEDFPGAVVVDEIASGSHGEGAGLQVGDVVRAFTACRMQMDQPMWQLMAGGIGIPKTFRFMYAADNQVFEQVMEAIVSNRMDPQGRPVLLVIERQRHDE